MTQTTLTPSEAFQIFFQATQQSEQHLHDVVRSALASGNGVILRTQYIITPLQIPDHVRMDRGRFQIRSGRKWVNLTKDQAAALALQTGWRPQADSAHAHT